MDHEILYSLFFNFVECSIHQSSVAFDVLIKNLQKLLRFRP